MKSLYEILGIKKGAAKQEIKDSYRDKAKSSHPDTGGSAEDFKEINRAYQILIDDNKRVRYDSGENLEDILNANQSVAKMLLMQLFCDIICNVEPDQVDFINLLKLNLQEKLREVEGFILLESRKKRRFEKAIKKVKSSKEVNLLKSLSEYQIEALNNSIKKFEQDKASVLEAQVMLNDFSYDFGEEVTFYLTTITT